MAPGEQVPEGFIHLYVGVIAQRFAVGCHQYVDENAELVSRASKGLDTFKEPLT